MIKDTDLPPLPPSDIADDRGQPLYCAMSTVRQAQRDAYKAGMLKAADMCDEISTDHWDRYKGRGKYESHCVGRADPHYQGMSDGADECSAAIIAATQGD